MYGDCYNNFFLCVTSSRLYALVNITVSVYFKRIYNNINDFTAGHFEKRKYIITVIIQYKYFISLLFGRRDRRKRGILLITILLSGNLFS